MRSSRGKGSTPLPGRVAALPSAPVTVPVDPLLRFLLPPPHVPLPDQRVLLWLAANRVSQRLVRRDGRPPAARQALPPRGPVRLHHPVAHPAREALAPGRACTLDDFPKLDATLRNRASRIVQWCEEWRFSDERAAEWEDAEGPSAAKAKRQGGTPSWEECVEKCEELWWMATVIYSAATRPGYKDIKLDFFL